MKKKTNPLPSALPAIRERSAAKMWAWGLAFPKLFILLEHRSHLEEFRQPELPSRSDESQSTRSSRQPGSQGPARPSPCLGRDFFLEKICHHPRFSPFPLPDPWQVPIPSQILPKSHQNPNTSGVQSEAQHGSCHAQGWIKRKILNQRENSSSWPWAQLVLREQGPMGWVWDVPCGAAGDALWESHP